MLRPHPHRREHRSDHWRPKFGVTVRLRHNDEEFLKTAFSVAASPAELLRHGCRLSIPYRGVTRFTDRRVATSHSGSRIPRSEGETRHDRDLGLAPDLFDSVPAWRSAGTRGQQVRRASAGSDASSALTAVAGAPEAARDAGKFSEGEARLL